MTVVVVGIGADGWDGLAPLSRAAVEAAEVLLGSDRQLDLVPASVTAHRQAWPSPMVPALPGLFETHAGRAVVVLASGDPMLSGVGTTLVRLLGPGQVRVLPAPSSVSLACARLGWAVEETEVVSLVGRPLELLHPRVQPGRRLLVLGSDGDTPAAVAALLTARGYGESTVTVLSELGGPAEAVHTGTAAAWTPTADPLVVTAVECRATRGTAPLPTTPGLPDGAYENDGQLTKNEVRAVTLSRLAAVPGQLLWDVGAGAGSIGIEWMRTHPSCRAVAVESVQERAERIVRNATRLGVPHLRVVHGRAPEVFGRLAPPDAVFVGGGATTPLLLDACWDALREGGRMVVNAVTVQSEAVLADWHARFGGELVRISVQRGEPVGGFTGWKPAMPVTIWSGTR
ncbi:precorrin-6Y methyltransferase [Geodermatophilus sp. Leaf369]|uniref:bifunctional cobalt-precorrin-7 (C(5))-methyltransferase/cobalt-precorrin-6B (C(15))-methyltransferase n=1 Tax=Geodermatophilus sp. Leaf369 TaxID=1736354 RepID=UPI0006FA22D1|nr:bifunctional cobalt-precorrin-7 (C(5))-methyltransferase/cobalt-precorrin-6B (C(15))-methyltransferase [Geodermatophilus sp. Leaf369]KQS60540.1 precorrin-6Y methyltransferase [Geodermatophilus sp. Leaf369]QNG37374.1 bifunctional cobalt-precorrin-7 (C(5))-methyltransferase/cobalt-precorrin-6B (C(15))-methyltransferase [Geodermatophilaceae bacterium NBWT11]